MAVTKQKTKSGRKRASTSSAIPKTILEKVQHSLTTLPEKPKEGIPLREALEQMQDVIVEALAKGYNHEDVASLLTQEGVTINAPSLKYHLSTLKRKKKGTKTTRGRRPKMDTKSISAAVDITPSSSEVPAKKPTRTKAPTKTPSKRAAKTKLTAAESSVAVEPTPPPAPEGAEPSMKKRGARSATTSAASTKPVTSSKTSSSRSRKK
jgi:hypothetical protein